MVVAGLVTIRNRRSEGTLIAFRRVARDDMAGAEIFTVGFDHQFAVGSAGGGSDERHLVNPMRPG